VIGVVRAARDVADPPSPTVRGGPRRHVIASTGRGRLHHRTQRPVTARTGYQPTPPAFTTHCDHWATRQAPSGAWRGAHGAPRPVTV